MSWRRACGALLGCVGALVNAAAGPSARSEPPFVQSGVRGDEQDEASGARPLDARRLRAAYLDLLGRPPLAEERTQSAGRTFEELVDELLGSGDFWRHWYEEQLYEFLLIDNFRPEGERMDALADELAAGQIDVREAVHRIALSSSFDQRNPGADTFVTVVMEQLDGLDVQSNARELELGKKIYDGASAQFLGSAGSSQSDIVRIAIEHVRFAETFLAREHRRLVRAPLERRELAALAREFQDDPGTFPALVRRWMLSPAYEKRLAQPATMPNRMFVRALFVDLADRLPDAEEARRMRGALDGLADPGPLRAVLARLLVDSRKVVLPAREDLGEPRAWVAGLFPRLYGREASERELEVFTQALADPACRPQTVVYALVSHPEYARY